MHVLEYISDQSSNNVLEQKLKGNPLIKIFFHFH